MKRAAIYCRISKDPTGTELGVKRQEVDCRQLCDRLGLEVAGVYIDDNVSAFVGKPRPQFDAMMKALAGGAFSVLVAWHPDRLTRHPRELEDLIDALKAAGATVQTCMAGEYDLATASGQTVARIVGAIAKGESLQKQERQRRKHEELAQRGRVSGGGTRPFGFEADRVTIRKAEAKIIRDLARRALAGETIRSLTADLIARQVPTVSGREWQPQVVRNMLSSGRIAGLRDHRSGEYPAVWDGIINVDDHRRLVALFADPNRRKHRGAGARYLLTGVAVCGLCGTKLVARPRNDGHKSIVCASGPAFGGCGKIRALSNPDADVVDTGFRTIDELVVRAVVERVDSPQFAALAAADENRDTNADMEELRRLDARLVELAEMWTAGELDRASWKAARERIEADRAAVNDRLRSDASRQAIKVAQSHAGTLREAWPAMHIDQRRAVLAAAIESVVVAPAVKGRNFFDPDRVSINWRA